MYFSNIHNPELQHFHKSIGVDFTMSLTDILNSDLFEIEEMGNNIYRVFPLFYCNNIISSNNQDKILDNRCLIIIQQESETYLSFMTNEDKSNIILDDTLINSKKKGNKLSMDEYNSLVYILRSHNTIEGRIYFEEVSLFEGVYANYELHNIEDIARNDEGFIITSELKTNPLTIKLCNPFFWNAKYTLTCTVKSLTGANIFDTDSTDFKTSDTFSINLVENNEIPLNVENYAKDSVILFDMKVTISFDVPEIVNSNNSLSLTLDKNLGIYGDTVLLTANLNGEVNEGYIVYFYKNNQLIDQETTDSNGRAVFEDTLNTAGTQVYSVKCLGLTDTVVLPMKNLESSLSITLNVDHGTPISRPTITGKLLVNDEPFANKDVLLYDNNKFVTTLQTDANGNVQYSNQFSVGDHSFYLRYEGDEISDGCESITVMYKCIHATNLSINTNKSSLYYGENVTISGVLTDESGAGVNNAKIHFYGYGGYSDETLTDSNGRYSFICPCTNIGTFNNLRTYFAGDATHASPMNLAEVGITVNKAPITIAISKQQRYAAGTPLTIFLASNYGTLNADKVYVTCNGITEIVTLRDGANNNKIGSYRVPVVVDGDYTLRIDYNGNDYYESSIFSESINIYCMYDPKVEIINNNNIKVTAKLKGLSDTVSNVKVDAIYISMDNGSYAKLEPNLYTNSEGYIIVSGYPFLTGHSYKIYAEIGEYYGDSTEFTY